MKPWPLSVAIAICVSAPVAGQTIVIEPDDYADATVLDTIHPHLTLSVTHSNNIPVPIFHVTSDTDGLHFAPTGTRVFGASDVPFWNNSQRLRIDFQAPISRIQIAFAGGEFFYTEIGRVQLFDGNNTMIGEYVTAPHIGGEVEIITLSRPQGDAAYAMAYVAENEGSFGRFDRLEVNLAGTTIPGDIDGDGDVDISDLTLLLASFGSCSGDGGFDAAADLDTNGCVTISDLTILLSHFGA